MRKVELAGVPALRNPHPDISGATVRSIINRASVGSERGMLSVAEFDPGGAHRLHRHAASTQVSYLLSGRGEHLTANGPALVRAGDAVHVLPNEWHGFRNIGTEPAVLVSLFSPAADPSEPGYESYAGEIDASRPPRVRKISLAGLKGDASLDEDSGFIGLGVYWLATRETLGTDSIVLGASTFEPGGVHEHHRHPNGDEFLFIIEGGGEHLTPDGAVPLSAGEIAFIPANEYHGFRNPEGVLTRTLFGYFGPASLSEAGYEVRPAGRP